MLVFISSTSFIIIMILKCICVNVKLAKKGDFGLNFLNCWIFKVLALYQFFLKQAETSLKCFL